MRLYFLKTPITSLVLSLALTSTHAGALDLNLNLEDKSALTRMTDNDWNMLRASAKDALENGSDGSSHVWKNPETSNAGVITILSTDNKDGSICRNTRFINTAGDLTSTTFVNLCKQAGKWTEISPRSTSTSTSSILKNNSSTSEMSNDSSTEITNKTLGQTSEYCRELFQNIEALKSKPARRSVAIDLHKAECLR